MRKTHLLGLLLWRGGILFAGGYAVWEGARWVLRFLDPPPVLEVGGALILAGSVLVLVSLVMERVTDLRAEGDLSDRSDASRGRA